MHLHWPRSAYCDWQTKRDPVTTKYGEEDYGVDA